MKGASSRRHGLGHEVDVANPQMRSSTDLTLVLHISAPDIVRLRTCTARQPYRFRRAWECLKPSPVWSLFTPYKKLCDTDEGLVNALQVHVKRSISGCPLYGFFAVWRAPCRSTVRPDTQCSGGLGMDKVCLFELNFLQPALPGRCSCRPTCNSEAWIRVTWSTLSSWCTLMMGHCVVYSMP